MVDESRTNIYDYLYDLFAGVVTENVYEKREPQDLTESDVTNGFLVLHVGELYDAGEFHGETYGWTRCYVEAFIPPISRGRLNRELFKTFEDSINSVIKAESGRNDGTYTIQEDSLLSMDADETYNANNQFFTFVKSFIVNIDKQQQ